MLHSSMEVTGHAGCIESENLPFNLHVLLFLGNSLMKATLRCKDLGGAICRSMIYDSTVSQCASYGSDHIGSFTKVSGDATGVYYLERLDNVSTCFTEH